MSHFTLEVILVLVLRSSKSIFWCQYICTLFERRTLTWSWVFRHRYLSEDFFLHWSTKLTSNTFIVVSDHNFVFKLSFLQFYFIKTNLNQNEVNDTTKVVYQLLFRHTLLTPVMSQPIRQCLLSWGRTADSRPVCVSSHHHEFWILTHERCRHVE